MGSTSTPEELDKALLGLLDANKDGKLSAVELAAAPAIFAPLDADENEIITTEELLRRPVQLPFFVQEDVPSTPAGAGLELMPLTRKGADTNLARRLLARYGPKPPGSPMPTARPAPRGGTQPATPPAPTARRLTIKDLKLDPKTFAALDQDGDEELDAEELARFADGCPPEVEVTFRTGTVAAGAKRAEVAVTGKPPVTAAVSGGVVAVEVPGVRLDLVPPAGATPRGAFRAQYASLFRSLDRDGNGYLDATEAGNYPLFREVFSLLDRDGDGKVFEKELTAAIDEVDGVATEAARGMMSVEVAEAGRGLLGLIDTDGDGRLSVREIRAMPSLVERFDANKDGAIAPGEVPRLFHATFSRGLTMANAPVATPVAFRTPGQRPPRPAVGPLWFQKMDRNRDGDVSHREFLGTDEDFRRLDADGDGLIDVREAEAAGRTGAALAPPPRPGPSR
jgi:Ca2+-binding EF-hand superfamily protein